ncbi:MAG: hypothetical protein U9Q06_02260 [Nanoarchaeota archaeon]|nr:hypothetical protein [Nanoarchaeota archaeon]
MSRLNNLYQSVKRHTGEIVVGALIIGALAGIRGCVKNMGEEVYRGNINEQEVVYSEGLYPCGDLSSADWIFGTKHQMKIKQGDVEYILIDESKETGIQNPDFAQAELERIVINTNSGKEDLRAKSQYGETLDDVHTKSVFEKGNKLYNNLRGKIREEVESGYRATESQFPQ